MMKMERKSVVEEKVTNRKNVSTKRQVLQKMNTRLVLNNKRIKVFSPIPCY